MLGERHMYAVYSICFRHMVAILMYTQLNFPWDEIIWRHWDYSSTWVRSHCVSYLPKNTSETAAAPQLRSTIMVLSHHVSSFLCYHQLKLGWQLTWSAVKTSAAAAQKEMCIWAWKRGLCLTQGGFNIVLLAGLYSLLKHRYLDTGKDNYNEKCVWRKQQVMLASNKDLIQYTLVIRGTKAVACVISLWHISLS